MGVVNLEKIYSNKIYNMLARIQSTPFRGPPRYTKSLGFNIRFLIQFASSTFLPRKFLFQFINRMNFDRLDQCYLLKILRVKVCSLKLCRNYEM